MGGKEEQMSKLNKRFVTLPELCAMKGWTRNDALHEHMLRRGLPVHKGKARLRDCSDDADIDMMCEDLVFDLEAIDTWERRGRAHTMTSLTSISRS
jgi:hypothetical protein